MASARLTMNIEKLRSVKIDNEWREVLDTYVKINNEWKESIK